jgi:AbiU2
MRALSDESEFERQLAIFHVEHVTAQQYFFSYASLRGIAASNGAVFKSMNATPLFWLTVESSMLLSMFIALGRIFDPGSPHNLARLMKTATEGRAIFSREALAARKRAEGLSADDADRFVSDAFDVFEPSVDDFKSLSKQIEEKREIYNARYRKVRNKVFAHNEVADIGKANALLKGTTVDEMKALFAFLDALDNALFDLLHNGRKLTLALRPFVLPPPKTVHGRPGEKIYQEVNAILQQITFGCTPGNG